MGEEGVDVAEDLVQALPARCSAEDSAMMVMAAQDGWEGLIALEVDAEVEGGVATEDLDTLASGGADVPDPDGAVVGGGEDVVGVGGPGLSRLSDLFPAHCNPKTCLVSFALDREAMAGEQTAPTVVKEKVQATSETPSEWPERVARRVRDLEVVPVAGAAEDLEEVVGKEDGGGGSRV